MDICALLTGFSTKRINHCSRNKISNKHDLLQNIILFFDFKLQKLTNNVEVSNKKDMIFAANKLISLGAKNVLIKGGHLNSKTLKDIFANKKGWIKKIHTRELGLILIELGGGRKQVTDKINFSVGFDNVATIGDIIDTSKPLITVYSQTENDYERLRKKIEDCFVITENEVSKLPEIYEVIK